MYHRFFNLIFLATISFKVANSEFIGSAETVSLNYGDRSWNTGINRLQSSEATPVATNTQNIHPTPILRHEEISTSATPSAKIIMTVTATRIGTTRYFQSSSSTSEITTPSPSVVYPFPSTSNTSKEIGNKTKLDSSSIETPLSLESMLRTSDEVINYDKGFSHETNSPESREVSEHSNEFIQGDRSNEVKDNSNSGFNTTDSGEALLPPTILREASFEKDISAAIDAMKAQTSTLITTNTPPTSASANTNTEKEFTSENSIENSGIGYGEGLLESSSTPTTTYEDDEDDLETEISNEQLPRPDALVGTNDGNSGPALEDEFAEAFKPQQESNFSPKRRRVKPGMNGRRKVRMRVRKVQPNGDEGYGTDVSPSEISITTEGARVGYRRVRTTTPVPPTLVSPDPSPPTIIPDSSSSKAIIKNGPYPISLQNEVTPQPQLERPLNTFTEQISTYFVPSQVPTTPKPPSQNEQRPSLSNGNETESGEWLQPSTSKHHDVHHVGEKRRPFVKERDSWEKNYMNLQQNSFFRSSPEIVSGEETLASINRKMEPEGRPSESNVPQLQRSQQNVLVLNSGDSPEIHEHHNHFDLGVFGIREDRNDGEKFPNMIEIAKAKEPESVLTRHQIPETFQGENHGQKGEESFSEELEIIPVNVHEVHEVGGHYVEDPGRSNGNAHNNNNPQQSHYDRTKHRVLELPSGDHSSETIHNNPKSNGPIRDVRLKRPPPPAQPPLQPQVEINSRHRSQPGPQATPTQIHPFQSDEFMGFGSEKHFNPEKIHKGIPGMEIFKNPTVKNPSYGQEFRKRQQDFIGSNQFHARPSFEAETQNSVKNVNNPQRFPQEIFKPQYHNMEPYKINTQAPKSPNFSPFPSQGQDGSSQNPRKNSVITDSTNFGPTGAMENTPFGTNKGNGAYRQLENAFMQNLIHSTTNSGLPPPPQGKGTHYDRPQGQFSPPYFRNTRTDPLKSGDFSKAHLSILGASSPSMTLPMPGLVSIPTPPSESHALSQVYSNRHYPPHTHSMSINPDYEPANPPVLKGHPLEYHFDPFIQNAGNYPDENPTTGNFKTPFSQPPTGQSQSQPSQKPKYIASEPPNNQYNDENQFEFLPPPRKSRKRKERKRYPKLNKVSSGQKDQNLYRGEFSQENSQSSDAKDTSGRQEPKLSPEELHNLYHEDESREVGHRVKPPKASRKQHPPPHIFSENAYVLMFPNMVPQTAMLPVKPYINGKEIPVLSASDPEFVEKALAKAASPGYHTVKVHPREQMLQVLASNHYKHEMEKYMQKKRQPPLPIHTPYGLLVPVGAPNTPPTSEYLSAESSNLREIKHKSRRQGKSQVGPALDDLAEKLAYRLTGYDNQVQVINHPPQYAGMVEHNHDSPYFNQDTSYSEHKPVRAPFSGKFKTPEANAKRSDEELKVALKSLLKERLEEMLEEFQQEENNVKQKLKNKTASKVSEGSPKTAASVLSYKFLPPPPPLGQILRTQSQHQPFVVPPSHSPVHLGFLQSIKRLLGFGKPIPPKQPNFNPHQRNNGSVTPSIHWGPLHEKEREILRKQGPLRLESRKKFELQKSRFTTTPEPESEEENQIDSDEIRPMKKLLKILLRRNRTTTASPITSTESVSGEVKTTRSIPNSRHNSRPPFVPSRSIEEIQWTPLPYPSRIKVQKRPEELLDQLQSESKTTNSGIRVVVPAIKSPAIENIKEIYDNSILDFGAYEELLYNAKVKQQKKENNGITRRSSNAPGDSVLFTFS